VLGFARLSAAAYGTIARVLEEDGIFRARVAEAADEDEIGRAGWLYLHRPVGWLDDPALRGAPAPGAADADAGTVASRREERAASRLRKAAADAEAARRRSADLLAEARRSEAEVRADRDRLAATVDRLEEERNAAVRRSKEVEAKLAATRRDLKVARQATMDAEAELAALRSAGSPPAAAVPAPAAPPTAPADPGTARAGPAFDPAEVAGSVAAASAAAAELASALADAARALDLAAPAEAPTADVASSARPPGPGGRAGASRSPRARRAARVQPSLPPGAFGGTPEAHRALLADRANLLVVDGYNVARVAWSGLAPEEERRRTVALLEDVQARSGGRVVVVFDGDDAVTAPKASRDVRVRFSATGQTADEAIVDLVAATPPSTPVVVVSSDRAVAADAKRQGAVAVGSRAFLTAAGR
jgi:hypothetical protein